MMVAINVPGETTSPALTGRPLTTPPMAPSPRRRPNCWRTRRGAPRASASCACAPSPPCGTVRGRARPALRPSPGSPSAPPSRSATASDCSADRTADCDESSASWSGRASMRAITAPRCTVCPSSARTSSTDPGILARTVASRPRAALPKAAALCGSRRRLTVTTLSRPMETPAAGPPPAGTGCAPFPPPRRREQRRAQERRPERGPEPRCCHALSLSDHDYRMPPPGTCGRRAARRARLGRRPGRSPRRCSRHQWQRFAQRQVGQQRHARPRHLHVARSLRAIDLRRLQDQPGIEQLQLRRDALAIAQVGDVVRPGAAPPCPRSPSTPPLPASRRASVASVSASESSTVSFCRARASPTSARR